MNGKTKTTKEIALLGDASLVKLRSISESRKLMPVVCLKHYPVVQANSDNCKR